MVSDSHHNEFYADCQDCVFFKKGYVLEIQGLAMRHSEQRYHTVIILNKADLLTTIRPPATLGEPTGPRKIPF